MLALILVAVAVGASNMAASVGVGAGGVSLGTRLRVILIFGLLEAGMPVVGLVIGHRLAADLSRESRWLAACLLVAIGGYGIVKAMREEGLAVIWPRRSGSDGAAASGAAGEGANGGHAGNRDVARTTGRSQSLKLLAAGVALSLDNLVAGFALGAYQVSVLLGAVVFGVVSTVMSLAGLEIGALIGKRASGGSGDFIGGAVLIGVGVAIGTGTLG